MFDTLIDLQAWCHTERRSLSRPFVRGGFRYATDGKAAVRLLAPGEPDTESPFPGIPWPDAQVIFAPAEKLTFAPWPANWEMWETMEIEGERVECPECHGETHECPRCDGLGQIECGECEQDYDCPECNGTGQVGEPCTACRGRGHITTPDKAFFLPGKAWVAERFLRRVINFPNLHYACQYPPAHKPVFFRFDGGEAAIMPVTGTEPSYTGAAEKA